MDREETGRRRLERQELVWDVTVERTAMTPRTERTVFFVGRWPRERAPTCPFDSVDLMRDSVLQLHFFFPARTGLVQIQPELLVECIFPGRLKRCRGCWLRAIQAENGAPVSAGVTTTLRVHVADNMA